jgi:ribosomal protein S27E
MANKSEFICSICKKILLEPIEFQCECSKTTRICNEHISIHCPNSFKRKKISIECVNCGEQLVKTNFVKAEQLQAQIENYSYLSNGEILFKKLLDTLLDKMTLIVNENFGFIVNN